MQYVENTLYSILFYAGINGREFIMKYSNNISNSNIPISNEIKPLQNILL